VAVTIATSLLALAGLTVQACSSDHGSRAPTFREQSVEITTVPEGAEFYLADGQQSPLAVANKAASITSRTALHPFGHVRFQTAKSGDPWGFVGNEEDRGSGISDFHARPYRPELGVFLAVDPVALLSPEQTIGNATRLLAYAYAGSDPITQADGNGLTFGQFVHGMWDQGVENVKAAAQATVASVRSNAALAMSGDIEGAAANVVVGAAHGMVQTVKDVGNFGNDFAKAVFAPNDYEAGRLAVKPVMTAMTVAGTVMGARMAVEKAGAARATRSVAGRGTETVQRAMSHAELAATRDTGLLRGGKGGIHYVTDAVNSSATRAQSRLALPVRPEVRVTMEVPAGRFSAPTRVQPLEVAPGKILPGGGMERTATGPVPVRVLGSSNL
jgi:RHS repeat-associated protein